MVRDSLRTGPRATPDPADLSLRALRVFVAVDEAGSMAGAAAPIGAREVA